YQVADIGPPVSFHWDDWNATNAIVEANGLMFFFQNDGSNGRELWRSDGTALGTYMLRDLCPGSCGSRNWFRGPLATVGERLFFAANDGVHGLELWVTDGTALGTTLVLDLQPGWESSFPAVLTAASGQLFFTARGADDVVALWRSDGTAKGTYRVSPEGVSFVNLSAIHPGPGFLYLCDAGSGAEEGLWRSDGTPGGTTFLAPLRCFDPYIDHGSNAALLPNGDLLVSAAGPLGGEELWRSDGTPGGTTLVADLRPGDIGSQPMHFARLGAEVVFTAGNGAGEASLYRSDGTTPGTTAVALPPGASPYPSFGPWAGDGARYYFSGSDAVHGLEPWVFDGLTAQLLADVVPGPTSSLDEDIFHRAFFAVLGGVLVFAADDGVHGEEIWRSDGTGPGTYRLSDLGPGPDPMAIVMWDGWHRPSVIDDQLYFFEEQSPDGYRLSRTDGTTVGPAVVRSIDHQSSAFDPVARDRGSLLEYDLGHNCFAATGAHIFFEQERAETYEPDLWMTDGSLAGTGVALAGFDSGYGFTPCAGTGDRLLFFDTQENQQALRALTPDAAPPVELLAGYGGSTMPPFLPSGPGLVFAMTDGLYRSDGTSGGTALIATTSFATWLAPWGDEVLFGGEALWVTQPASTEPLELTPPASVTAVNEIVTLGSRIVFVAESDAAGSELWLSQGVPGDATLLADLLPGSTGALLRVGGLDGMMDARAPQLVALEDVALFVALLPSFGRELWVTDGTPLGTGLLRDIYSGDYPSTPRNLTRLGNRIVFSAEDEEHGRELWVTDGTYPGTVLLEDAAPGPASSSPDDLVVRDGLLYFSAWSPNYGREAWQSDGTTAGTVRISDIAPGPLSSSPQRFARAGDRLYFSATDQVHGYELWAISDDGSIPLFLDGFESSDTARWSLALP
ncbi:MAG: hypothetical protein QG573_398, partial [Acidobacteriota bacterium]|nr:hypothetical protein [Acidobacteriota bacterium]